MSLFQKLWAVIATMCVAAACYISKSDYDVTAASITGIVFVIGVANGWKHSNFFGAVFSALLGYISYEHGLFGNALINAGFCMPLCLYGWYSWVNDSKDSTVKAKTLSSNGRFYYTGLTIISMCGSITFSYLSASNMWLYDGVSSTLPIIATVLLVLAYKEQWYVWIAYNALEVLMWFEISNSSQEVLAILVMKVVFLLNSLIGLYQWVIKPKMENK